MNLKFTTFILFVFLMFSQQALSQDYKLGVVMYHHDKPAGYDEDQLNKIVHEIASDDVYREGNGNTLQLVVQTEISWKDTSPEEGIYDFSKFVEYAKAMKARGIKWTPLLAAHNIPEWAKVKYYNNIPTNKKGERHFNANGETTDGIFLPFSPSSMVWRKEITNWMNAALEQLNPYIGKTKNDVISEIFITNEMMYKGGKLTDEVKEVKKDSSVITTFDEATLQAWQTRNYESLYGVIPRNFYLESSYRIDAFLKFRAEELAYCLGYLKSSVEYKLASLGKNSVPVTWKLTPYRFDAKPDKEPYFSGLTGSQVSYLFNDINPKIIAIDEWEHDGSGSSLVDAIGTVRRFDRQNHPIYLAEFNKMEDQYPYGLPTKEQILSWIKKTKPLNVTNWTFFSWNGTGTVGTHEGPIQPEQKQGLKDAFNYILPPDGIQNDPYARSLAVNNSNASYGRVSSLPAGINCGQGYSSCSTMFSGNVTLTATAASSSYKFSGWSGACSGTSPTCTVSMTSAKNVTASFAQNIVSYSLAVSNISSSYGRVTSSPTGINCGQGYSACNATFSGNVTLTATPTSSSYKFSGWGGDCSGTSTTCTVNMTSVKNVTANFTQNIVSYSLAVNNTNASYGRVTSSPSGINCGQGYSTCNATFSGNVTLTATPASSSYQFSGWGGACSGTASTCTVSMTAAKNVTATFTAIPVYRLASTVSTTGGGTWGSILKLSASLSGTTLNLTVNKTDGSSFSTGGTLYFKVGSYETYGVNRCQLSLTAATSSKSCTHDLATFSGYPKDFYVRFNSNNGGFAWVGPIRVTLQ